MSIYATRIEIARDDPESEPGTISAYTGNNTGRIEDRDPGGVSTAHIPGFCWDHDADEIEDHPFGPWLRLSIWNPDTYLDVNLDAEAARSLRDDLTAWLDSDHLPHRPAPGVRAAEPIPTREDNQHG